MGDQGSNALTALILGSVVAVLLFIPVAAVQYRRDGRLGPGDLAVVVDPAQRPALDVSLEPEDAGPEHSGHSIAHAP